ncbi:MAG: hypothetical protein JWO38_931 [Gemmataceae bacterium]|nr:hypothetical protein [Gemmataceae bacterium]
MPFGSLDSNQNFPDDAQAEGYTAWGTDDEFSHDPGTFALPIALTDSEMAQGKSPVSIGRVHAPFRQKTTRFQAKKRLTPPVIPAPINTGAFVFLGGTVSFPSPAHSTTGVDHEWSANGTYLYVENCHDVPLRDGYVLSSPPYLSAIGQSNMSTTPPSVPQGSKGAIAFAGTDARVGVALAKSVTPGNNLARLSTTSWFPGTSLDATLINGGPPGLYPMPTLQYAPGSPPPQATFGYDSLTLFLTNAPADLDPTAEVRPPANGWPGGG